MSFSEFGLDPRLVQAAQRMGFTTPTPIQEAAIPPLLLGRDVMASAMTGSGKTAAFLLPILHALLQKPRGGTRALVVVPTRELAVQIADHLCSLADRTGLRGAAIYGGVAMGPQEQAFRTGADVLIATPGRLLDHLQRSYAGLGGIEWLVLDEADRMLDMGFLPDIHRIVARLPKARRTLLFSATLPDPIVGLATEMLRDPVRLHIQRKAAPPTTISQRAYSVPHDLKSHLLLALLRQGAAPSVLAFTRTKHRADRLADFLARQGVPCARIHGNRSQAQRLDALAGFKRGQFQVLVATDVAARGIDVVALSLVVNVDVPHVPEDYIHRVGRTARASAAGEAYTFVSPDEESNLRAIERLLGKPLPRHRADGFDYAARPATRLEIPLAERLAALRTRRSEERARAVAKTGRPALRGTSRPSGRPSGPGRGATPQAFERRSGNTARVGAGLAWLRQATERPR